MKLRQLTQFSDKLLKGKRTLAFLIALMPVGAELLFRLTETAVCSVILYYTGMKPLGLFTGENLVQQLTSLACTALRLMTLAPLSYATALWFSRLCDGDTGRKSLRLTRVILSPKIYGRSFTALLISKAVSFVFLIPATLFGGITFTLISESLSGSGELRLMITVHATVMTLFSLFLWLRAKLTLIAVPFLLVRFPQRGALRVTRDAFRFMQGRRITLIKILLRYVPMMLPIVTIPVLLPKLFTAAALYIGICLREDEYLEKNRIYRDLGKANDASKLPFGTKRRFPKAADKAQAN